MRVKISDLSNPDVSTVIPSTLSPFAHPTTKKKQRLKDIANPVTNIGTRPLGEGKQWIGPITPYSLGGRAPEPGSIETLVPPQRYLQEEKKQAEEQGYVFNYLFNPTPVEGSGIPATSPPSTIPLVSTILPSSSQMSSEAAQEIPYNLIIIGVIGIAAIYLLKKGKK